MHLACPDSPRLTGTLPADGHGPVPCLAGSSDTSTSRDDPATISCMSHQSRQIALKRSRHLPLKVTAKVWQSDRYRSLWDGYSPTPGSWSRAPAGSRPRRMGHAKSPDDNNAARSDGECDVSHITDACHAGSGRTTLRPIGGSAMDFESCLSRARIQGRLESGQRRGRNCDWGRSACSLTAARRFCEWSRPATKKLRRQG